MILYAILDLRLREFGPVLSEKNDAGMRRALAQHLGQPGMLSKHPADFVLYRLGGYDAETGVITPEDVPVVVASVVEVMQEFSLNGEAE